MEQAEQIKALRAATGLTQKEFAARFGIPHRTLISLFRLVAARSTDAQSQKFLSIFGGEFL